MKTTIDLCSLDIGISMNLFIIAAMWRLNSEFGGKAAKNNYLGKVYIFYKLILNISVGLDYFRIF